MELAVINFDMINTPFIVVHGSPSYSGLGIKQNDKSNIFLSPRWAVFEKKLIQYLVDQMPGLLFINTFPKIISTLSSPTVTENQSQGQGDNVDSKKYKINRYGLQLSHKTAHLIFRENLLHNVIQVSKESVNNCF